MGWDPENLMEAGVVINADAGASVRLRALLDLGDPKLNCYTMN
jgi:hypothetical protein